MLTFSKRVQFKEQYFSNILHITMRVHKDYFKIEFIMYLTPHAKLLTKYKLKEKNASSSSIKHLLIKII